MDLDYEVSDLESVPEAVRGFYIEKDGKHVLRVKGVVSKATHDEFRNNNIALSNQVKKIQPLIALLGEDGLTPDKLEQRIASLAESKVGEMKTTYEQQVQELANERANALQRLNNLVLTDEVTKKALKHGVVESALEDVVNRAKSIFTVDETGKVKPTDSAPRNKKGEPLSVEDWLAGLADTAKHFFGQTRGGGATTPAGGVNAPALTTNEKLAAGLKSKGILK